jgi:HEAT repeat protein
VLHLVIDSGGSSAAEVFKLLGTIGDGEARKLIESALKSGNSWASPAAQGLSAAQCRAYLPLLKRLAQDNSLTGKQSVLACIGEAGNAEAAEILLDVADSAGEPDSGVAFGLLESMGSTAEPALAKEVREGQTASKRETAAYSLPRRGAQSEILAFRTALHDPDPRVRVAGALGLAQLGSSAGDPELEMAAEGSDPEERREAAAALAALGAPRSITRLTALLGVPDQASKLKTVWAITRIGGPRLKDFVYALGLQKQPEFRSMLAQKLLEPSDARDLAVLAGMLTGPDEFTQLSAAGRLLGSRFAGQAQAVIRRGLGSKTDAARDLALNLALQNTSLHAALSEFTGSSDPVLREAAITAAGDLRQRDKFGFLESYLQDGLPGVSLAAAKALVSIDRVAARPILLRGINSGSNYFRIYSAVMLLSMGRQNALPA